MIEFEHLTNPEKYHTVPPRGEGEKDKQYKSRLKAYVQGIESQQAKINELLARVDAIHDIIRKAKKSKSGNYLINEIDTVLEGNKDEN